jgi:hypothetical protein
MKENIKSELEEMLKSINFDEYFIEATFQFKLLMALGKKYCEDDIFPERSITYYDLDPSDYEKKEIDIVYKRKENENIAIELKMPMNGQYPEQMFKFVQDIKFLEELKTTKIFSECFLITVTNDKGFWEGNEIGGIYSYFRNSKVLTGAIYKPTGQNRDLYYEIKNKYKIEWENIKDRFKYFIIEI